MKPQDGSLRSMPTNTFHLDLTETFPRLARPPIVEAVIHWQARAQTSWEPDALKRHLTEKLPDYPQFAVIRSRQLVAMFGALQSEAIEQHQADSFQGYRMTSGDGRFVAQFTRDGLAFSQVRDYEHWESFCDAGAKAWRVFGEVAEPLEIQRLGVRVINHIPVATPETVGEFLREPPTCPTNLPLNEFVYQSTFTVPEHSLGVRVIKVMQPPVPQLQASSGLFLDIDVFTTRAIENMPAALGDVLPKMRWLKNKVFFSLLQEDAMRSFS